MLPISYGLGKKPTDKLHFFLFNDIFVYARPSDVKKQMDMSKAETKYPLMLVWLRDHRAWRWPPNCRAKLTSVPAAAENMFEIIAPGISFLCHTASIDGTSLAGQLSRTSGTLTKSRLREATVDAGDSGCDPADPAAVSRLH